MLLHVEELQMQKDIRNYDMKGVVFQQEKEDRRFLVLEVSRWSGTSNGSSNIERHGRDAVWIFNLIYLLPRSQNFSILYFYFRGTCKLAKRARPR